MEHLDLIPGLLRGKGVEIGAFKTPLPGITPVYLDRFAEYAGERTLADYYGDACSIPFADSSLDYVATSHVLEHVANPLAALREWYRALRHGGVVYLVVPDRRKTFDHPRALTSVEHMRDDFLRGTTQVDGTHIDDFAFGVEWALFSPHCPPAEAPAAREALAAGYRHAIAHGQEINIHFHTFEPTTGVALIEAGNEARLWPGRFVIEHVHEDFPASNPNGFLIVARVRKTVGERLRALVEPPGLLPTARRMSAPVSDSRFSSGN
jgi:SAM-dependent methyltransferase